MLNQLDEKKIVLRFNKAALTYDKAALLQYKVGKALFDRLQGIRIRPHTILDLGCGTGHFTSRFRQAYPQAKIINLDKAFNMLQRGKIQQKEGCLPAIYWLGGEAERLPFLEQSFDLIYSNLMLHWSIDFSQVLKELGRILKPDGLLLFSMVGIDTLKELRYCWARVDNRPHVHVFSDMHDLGDSLLQNFFTDPVLDVEYYTVLYKDVLTLMRDLKQLGAQNLSVGRHRGLTTKKSLQNCIHFYEEFRDAKGRLPATWEIIYGHAFAPRYIGNSQEIKIALNEIGGRVVRN
jgi:malonyl-CoA O-methyltransferase